MMEDKNLCFLNGSMEAPKHEAISLEHLEQAGGHNPATTTTTAILRAGVEGAPSWSYLGSWTALLSFGPLFEDAKT